MTQKSGHASAGAQGNCEQAALAQNCRLAGFKEHAIDDKSLSHEARVRQGSCSKGNAHWQGHQAVVAAIGSQEVEVLLAVVALPALVFIRDGQPQHC